MWYIKDMELQIHGSNEHGESNIWGRTTSSKLFKSLPHKAAFSPSWLPLIYMLVIPCMQPRKPNLKQNLMMIQMDNFLKFLKKKVSMNIILSLIINCWGYCIMNARSWVEIVSQDIQGVET